MGKRKKAQPIRLAEKLARVRKFFGFSQEEMIKFVIPDTEDAACARAAVSDYEAGRRAPSHLETLNYARTVRLLSRYKEFNVEDLINDRRDLPFAPSLIAEARQSSEATGGVFRQKEPIDLSGGQENAAAPPNEGSSAATFENHAISRDKEETKPLFESPSALISGGDYAPPSLNGAPGEIDTETCAIVLPKKTLLRIDNIRHYVSIQYADFPRPSAAEFIARLLEAAADEYDEGSGNCSIIEKMKKDFRSSH